MHYHLPYTPPFSNFYKTESIKNISIPNFKKATYDILQ